MATISTHDKSELRRLLSARTHRLDEVMPIAVAVLGVIRDKIKNVSQIPITAEIYATDENLHTLSDITLSIADTAMAQYSPGNAPYAKIVGNTVVRDILLGERVSELYEHECGVAAGIAPWELGFVTRSLIGLDASAAVNTIRDAQQYVSRVHGDFWNNAQRWIGQYIERYVLNEASAAKSAREAQASEFAAIERLQLAAEEKRELSLGRAASRSIDETLEEGARRRASTIKAGKTGLRPGYKKALVERAAERARELEIGEGKVEIVREEPEAREGIETEAYTCSDVTDIVDSALDIVDLIEAIAGKEKSAQTRADLLHERDMIQSAIKSTLSGNYPYAEAILDMTLDGIHRLIPEHFLKPGVRSRIVNAIRELKIRISSQSMESRETEADASEEIARRAGMIEINPRRRHR